MDLASALMIAGTLRRRNIEETSMKNIALAVMSGVALLGLASLASAQGVGTALVLLAQTNAGT
jgi:hypothetical protein